MVEGGCLYMISLPLVFLFLFVFCLHYTFLLYFCLFCEDRDYILDTFVVQYYIYIRDIYTFAAVI